MLQYWLLGLTLFALPFWWDEPVTWELVDATPLVEFVEFDGRPFNPILAPDGSALAWDGEDATCVYRFEEAATECFPWPENAALRSGSVNLPAWSPDGRYIAQTENFFHFFRDSDIWTLDTQTGEMVDRTDDGYFGGLLSSDAPDNWSIDYLPSWNPATGELYFFRSQERAQVLVDTGYTLQLYKMGADGGEPELVRDLTLAVPGPFAVFRPVAFSDDGTKLAFLVVPNNHRESPGTGVWVLDFANGGTEMVAGYARLISALPQWTREGTMPYNVQWAGDDLIVWMDNLQMTNAVARTPVYLDTDTREVTTLIDFTTFDDADEYISARTDDPSVYDMAVTGTVLPGSPTYWLMTRGRSDDDLAIFELPLPGHDAEPAQVTTIPNQLGPGQDTLPTASDDGKLLMLHTLFKLQPVESEE